MKKYLIKLILAEAKKQGVTVILSVLNTVLTHWITNVRGSHFVDNPDNDRGIFNSSNDDNDLQNFGTN